MKLYYAPGACSLADHIALHEAGLKFDCDKVDLATKKTESGEDYLTVNPKGYVPALALDEGGVLTENIAILDWIAGQDSRLAPTGTLGRTRLVEMLAFISTEIHKSFKPYFAGGDDDARKKAADAIGRRFAEIVTMMQGDYLFGEQAGVADAYLFVMLMWADKTGVAYPPPLTAFRDRMTARTAVRTALEHEGLA